MDEKWIAIARTGQFTDSLERPQGFTTGDLDAIAASYDPKQLEAPLVFGHPQDNAPAFGWVRQLKRQGEKLFAQFAQVPPGVQRLVAQGRYKYVSMSLMPDRTRLRHVGLLGAAVPAIEGLGPVSFTHADSSITVNFSAADMQGANTMPTPPTPEDIQQQLGALTEQVNALKAEKAQLQEQLAKAQSEKGSAEQQATEANAEFAAFKQQLSDKQREARVVVLINAGKIPPADKDKTLSFAAALSALPSAVDFAAPNSGGKASGEKISAEEHYFRELEQRPEDPRFTDFSAFAPAPAHAAQQTPTFSAASIAAKL